MSRDVRGTSILTNKLETDPYELEHLRQMDNIMNSVFPEFVQQCAKIREHIEFTLCNNPKSKKDVVAYLASREEEVQRILKSGDRRVIFESMQVANDENYGEKNPVEVIMESTQRKRKVLASSNLNDDDDDDVKKAT